MSNLLAIPLIKLVVQTGDNEDWIDPILFLVNDGLDPPQTQVDLRGIAFEMEVRRDEPVHEVVITASTENGMLMIGEVPDYGYLIIQVPLHAIKPNPAASTPPTSLAATRPTLAPLCRSISPSFQGSPDDHHRLEHRAPGGDDETGDFIPSVVAVTAPYAPRGPIIAGTSNTTNALISTGLVSFTMNEPSLEFHEGARLRASVIGGSNLYLEGEVASYDTIARLLTLAADLSSAVGGSYSNWAINVAGEPGSPGPERTGWRPWRTNRSHGANGIQGTARHQRRHRLDRPERTLGRSWHTWRRLRTQRCHGAVLELPARAGRPVRAGRSDPLAAR